MKGLLYRELLLAKKFYGLSMVMFVIIAAINIMVRMSMQFGNLAHLPEDSIFKINQNALTVMNALPCVIVFICLCTDGGVIFTDFKSGWVKFCAAAPLSEKKLVGVKLAARIISMLTALVISVLYYLIICGIENKPFTADTFKSILFVFTLVTVVSVLYITLSIIFKDKNTVTIILVGILSLVYIPTVAVVFRAMQSLESLSQSDSDDAVMNFIMEKFADIRDITAMISLPVAAAAVAAGYAAAVMFLKRREN